MDLFFEAISLYRRRKYDVCIEKCNLLLQNDCSSGGGMGGSHGVLQQGPWELKMRAMTQRIYVDDIEATDGIADEDDDFNTNRLATAPRLGTTMRTAAVPNPRIGTSNARPRTTTGRALTGMARPGTISQRPGSSLKGRTGTGSRSGSARNIRLGSASMFALGDPTGNLFDASKLNPHKFAHRSAVSKILFEFLYYHEGDIRKSLDLCEAVAAHHQKQTSWWWNTQRGRCHLTLGKPRDAEQYLKKSLGQFPHPDTALLLARVYVKVDQPLAALEVLDVALEKMPDDTGLLTQQGRIFELMDNLQASARMYRHIAQLEPVNAEALASIAVHHFYGNQPEMALMYYRRILSMGVQSCELYCNIGLCCVYGGQLDLVLPCFQRAMRITTTPEQRADLWYNMSFVAMTNGDLNLARRCLRLCVGIDGAHGAALNNLAVLTIQCGQNERGRAYLTAAKSVLPGSEEVKTNCKLFDSIQTESSNDT